MRTSEQIKAEIEERFGFIPPFFGPALESPEVLENLWQQTLTAYFNNPLSSLFKEKLSAYLSRYCAVPYCMICHSCALLPLGIQAREVLQLLESPPPVGIEIDEHFSVLMQAPGGLLVLPAPGSVVEASLLYCCIFIFLEGDQVEYYRSKLHCLLGAVNYQHLVTFVAYVRTCHLWMEAHPEVGYEADKRAIDHLDVLLKNEPGLADFFCNYRQKIIDERQSWAQRQDEITKRKQAEVLLRARVAEAANQKLEKEIAERKRAEAQLFHNAFHDALTNLPNRAMLMERLGRVAAHTNRHEDHFCALLFLDLDRFKVINDSLGHSVGDQLLIKLAQRLTTCVRPLDTIARVGGDEFVILLEDVQDISDATRIAERIQQELRLPFTLRVSDCVKSYEVFTTVSIGIVLSCRGNSSSTNLDKRPEGLLRDADIAMYRAKQLGRARYEIFDTAMHTHVAELLQLETDLRRAIERQEFQLFYQPIVSLKTSSITGFEALVRWEHPTRGWVSPADFIPVAEETGLIVPLGQWVLAQACHQMNAWQVQFPMSPPLTISVNLSVKQFAQPDLTEQVAQILQETKLDPESLRLEITESVLINNAESVTVVLLQLKGLGVSLSLDDFGTGYSSLSYLHRFPIDNLKIDRSFVSRMGFGDKNSKIVQAIILLAQALDIDVIAEGIETVEQQAQLTALQCNYGQGYLFSKPLASAQAGALISCCVAGGPRTTFDVQPLLKLVQNQERIN